MMNWLKKSFSNDSRKANGNTRSGHADGSYVLPEYFYRWYLHRWNRRSRRARHPYFKPIVQKGTFYRD